MRRRLVSAPLVSSLKNPRFLKLWAGQCVSALGDRFTQLALLSLVMMADTSWEQAKLDFCAFLPFLAGPFVGVLVDRSSRKRLMVGADLVRAALVLALFAFGLKAGANFSGIYPLLFAMGLMTAVFSTSKSASLPDLCAPTQVLPSAALLAATGVAGTALGGVLGGWIVDHWGFRACLVIDAITFVVSAASVAWIAFPPAPERTLTDPGQVLADLRKGFQEIRRNPELIKICSFLFIFWFTANSVKVVSPNFGKEVLGLGSGDMTSLGKILAVAGIGLLAGAGVTAVAGHRIQRRAAYFVASAGMGLSIFGLASTHTMTGALAFLFLAGFSGGTLVSRIDADILKVIDPGIRGRVFGANAVVFAVALLSPLLPIGWLTKHMAAVDILRILATLLTGLGAIVGVRLLRDLKAGKPLVLPP